MQLQLLFVEIFSLKYYSSTFVVNSILLHIYLLLCLQNTNEEVMQHSSFKGQNSKVEEGQYSQEGGLSGTRL